MWAPWRGPAHSHWWAHAMVPYRDAVALHPASAQLNLRACSPWRAGTHGAVAAAGWSDRATRMSVWCTQQHVHCAWICKKQSNLIKRVAWHRTHTPIAQPIRSRTQHAARPTASQDVSCSTRAAWAAAASGDTHRAARAASAHARWPLPRRRAGAWGRLAGAARRVRCPAAKAGTPVCCGSGCCARRRSPRCRRGRMHAGQASSLPAVALSSASIPVVFAVYGATPGPA